MNSSQYHTYLKGENRECDFFNRYIPSTEIREISMELYLCWKNYDQPVSVVGLSVDCEKLPTEKFQMFRIRYSSLVLCF